MSNLLFFYGEECPHCKNMHALLDRIEKEESVSISRIEVWHNAENLKILESYDKEYCGGVPFLFNTETKKWMCGEISYDELKTWAADK